MDLNNINSEDLLERPLHNIYTKSLLNTLKDWEHVSLEWDDCNFVFYRNDKNGFWVQHNSAWIDFGDNPMTQKEMEHVLNPIISHADSFEWKIPSNLLASLWHIFAKNNNEYINFKIENLLKNITLEDILSNIEFNKQLLIATESKVFTGIVKYLENATNILNELTSQYPEKSVIRNMIQEKLNYLESYKKTFSDWKFIEWIKNNISDLNNLLDILENQDPEWELANQIKEQRNRKDKKDYSAEINAFFGKIYAWDKFAIHYSLYSDNSFFRSLDEWHRAYAEAYWFTKWSEEINRLWKKQEPLMDENLLFKEKEKAFEDANQEYLNSLWFILWTGHNSLPSDKEYYENFKKQIKLEEFISMPCSDVYPAVLQKTILPLYLKDLYNETCELLWKKTLDKSIDQYINEIKNPSWLNKLASAFKNNEKKIESLKEISEKIRLLRKKFDNLDKQIKRFWDKRQEYLVKLAIEFCVIENFGKLNNTGIYATFILSDQDKWLNFMKKN